MKAVVFKGKDRLAAEDVPRPHPRAGEAVIRITTTTHLRHGRTYRPRRISGQAWSDIETAFDVFSRQRDGVLKVALHPAMTSVGASRPATVGAVDESCS